MRGYIMTAIISKWGNSQGLRIPKNVMKDLNLSVGNKVIIEPIKNRRKKYDINDLVNKIPDNYKPHEEFNAKVGIEEW